MVVETLGLNPDPGRTIFTRPLPAFVRSWVENVCSSDLCTDDYGELVRVVGQQNVLRRLVEDPTIARRLRNIHARLEARGDVDANERVLHFLATACFACGISRPRSFQANAEVAADLRAAAKACRRLAKTVRGVSRHCPGADTIGYLTEVVNSDVRRAARRRRGIRAGRYTIGAPLRLTALLETFAAVLDDELRDGLGTASAGKMRAGVQAARRCQIDRLIRHAAASLGHVPYALIATMVSILNDMDVDESVVRKRASAIRRKRPGIS